MENKEYRSQDNPRAGGDRRKYNDPGYKGIERRIAKDRRRWKDRRSN